MTEGPPAPSGPPGRDRDPAGRPRNARPRDGLGRPLARGESGAERVPDDFWLQPRESLAEAQRMITDGRPFHAHEVLEASWKSSPAAERELWRGLAQIAVGLTHALRGNIPGGTALLRRGAERVSAYAPADPHGVPAAALAGQARDLAAALERDGAAALVGARVTLVGEVPPPAPGSP